MKPISISFNHPMNPRNLIKLFAVATIFTTPLLPGANTASASVVSQQVKKDKRLHVGETKNYDKGGLTVTFLAVKKDHRCPMNAKCISAGDAQVVLRVKAGNQKAKIVTIHTNEKRTHFTIPANRYPDGIAGIPKSYTISVGSLTPQPYAGKKTPQRAYRLKLNVAIAL